MYRKQQHEQREFEAFHLSFGGRLSSRNRWVRLAKLIPWERIESRYAAGFRSSTGPPALIARIAVGSLIIKEKLQLSDEETVEQIRENPYLQYFLGYPAFSDDRPFDPAMLVQFRKRVSGAILSQINDLIIAGQSEDTGDDGPSAGAGRSEESEDGDPTRDAIENDGTLLMDATCVPAATLWTA